MKQIFKDAKCGDEVWSHLHGEGRIINDLSHTSSTVTVSFLHDHTSIRYWLDGKYKGKDKYPELLKQKPKSRKKLKSKIKLLNEANNFNCKTLDEVNEKLNKANWQISEYQEENIKLFNDNAALKEENEDLKQSCSSAWKKMSEKESSDSEVLRLIDLSIELEAKNLALVKKNKSLNDAYAEGIISGVKSRTDRVEMLVCENEKLNSENRLLKKIKTVHFDGEVNNLIYHNKKLQEKYDSNEKAILSCKNINTELNDKINCLENALRKYLNEPS